MRKNPVLLGIVGTLFMVLAVLATLNAANLPIIGNKDGLTVEFAEAGGLESGDDVIVSGAKVGTVREVKLDRGVVGAKITLEHDAVRLGQESQAKIVTVTLLGRAALELVPKGSGTLSDGATIPVSRTSSPYNITSALSQLATETGQIDKAQLTQAFDQVSETFAGTPDDIKKALEGITRVSGAIGDNDEALKSLLESSSRVTQVLADRDTQIATLLTSGNNLLEELDTRQAVVESVLNSGQQLARQLRLALDENDQAVGPALKELNVLLATLNRNKENLQGTISGLRNYATAFGEAVSSGPFFDAYVQNLTAPASLAPVLSGMLQ